MDFFGKFEKVFFEAASSSSLELPSSESTTSDAGNAPPQMAYYDGRDLFYSSVDINKVNFICLFAIIIKIIKDCGTYDVEYPEMRSRSEKDVPFTVTVKKNKCLTDTVTLFRERPNQQMDPILMAFFEVMLKHSLYRKV